MSETFGIDEDNISGKKSDHFFKSTGSLENDSEIVFGDKSYDVSVFFVPDWRGRPSTKCCILREITDRVRLEKKLRLLHMYATLISKANCFDYVGDVTANALKNSLGFSDGLLILAEEGFPVLKQVWGPVDCVLDSVLVDELMKLESRYFERFEEFLTEIEYEENCKYAEKAMLSVPILENQKQIGVICIFRAQKSIFTDNERMLLEIFWNHIALAVHGIQHDQAILEVQKAEILKILEGAVRVSNMVRHDLRGPLQTIRNAAYLIEKNPNSIDRMVPIINNTIEYMVKVIEDLVYTENISDTEKLFLNLNSLIKQVLIQQIVPSNIIVEKNLYPGFLEGSFDKVKIQRMLDNLIRNAIEAMPDGGTLTILTDRTDSDIIIRVQDTGTGIEDISKMFVPFHTTKLNGMGLGLVSVKQTVEAHYGTITVDSEPNEGTCFTIKFPLGENQMENSVTRLNSITAT